MRNKPTLIFASICLLAGCGLPGAVLAQSVEANSALPASQANALIVSPGPAFEERQALLQHIQQAGANGIGTANYLNAFGALNETVKSGASPEQVKAKADQLTNELKEQLKRAIILKGQRQIPSTQPLASPSFTAGVKLPNTAVINAPPSDLPNKDFLNGNSSNGNSLNRNSLNKDAMNEDSLKNWLSSPKGAAILEKLRENLHGGVSIPNELLQNDKAKELIKRYTGQ